MMIEVAGKSTSQVIKKLVVYSELVTLTYNQWRFGT